jgi:hypothetical protein
MFEGSAIAETHLLIGFYAYARPVPGRVALTLANRNDGRVAVGIHIKAIITGFLYCESNVRGVDFVNFGTKQFAYMQVQRALMQFQLHSAIVDIRQRETALGIHSKGSATDV